MILIMPLMCALTLITVGAAFAYFYFYDREALSFIKPKRRLSLGDDGELVAVGDGIQRGEPVVIRRIGTYASEPLVMEAGLYRLQYRFPDSDTVRVDLINVRNAEKQVVGIKSGSGSMALTVPRNGHYMFQVEPGSDETNWELRCTRV